MSGLRGLLFKLWIKRTNIRWEKVFLKRLKQEQDTVRLNWAEVFGAEYAPGRHHLRKR